VKMPARTLAIAFAACLAAPLSFAQPYEETAAAATASAPQAAFSDAQLDQMLAPIALYPDELLSQILMASTYPLEVVEAARWSRANPNLLGDDAVSAVVSMDWDPSVKSLVAFPDILQQMDENLDWTQGLGEAFLGQQSGVMASVQRLRAAASQAGNLASSDEMAVSREGDGIAIDSSSPDTVYVPYYDPNAVYGTWWWPSYPPVYWAPWPGYYWAGYGFAWTVGIPVGVDFFYGDFDWHHHHVRVYDHHPFYVHDHDHDHDQNDHRWRYDPHHRRNVQFHNPVVRQEFAGATTPRLPRASGRPPQSAGRTPHPGGRSAPQASGSPLARPNAAQPATHAAQPATRAAPGGERSSPQQGFFPQQRAPQHAEGQAPARPVHPPAGQVQGQPRYVQPQPLARPAVPQQGVHLGPQYQVPQAQVAQPAPQIVRPMPQVVHPLPQVVHPVPAEPPPAQPQQGEEAPRAGTR